MKSSRILLGISLFLFAAATVSFGRSILERKVFYVNTVTGKSGLAKFWVVFLGTHEVTLTRKYPGEEPQKVSGNMNLQLLSSGYIEGNGYSTKGKLECLPVMKMKNDKGITQISIDSIDCIYDFGGKVRTLKGETGEFIVDCEGQMITPTKFLMREYKMTNYYGEEILKEGSDEIKVSAIAFTKEGLARIPK
jgi:hypothetical protein